MYLECGNDFNNWAFNRIVREKVFAVDEQQHANDIQQQQLEWLSSSKKKH